MTNKPNGALVKIHAVMGEIGTMAKGDPVKGLGYGFVNVNDMVAKVKDLMFEHGLASYQVEGNIGLEEQIVGYTNDGVPNRSKNIRTYSAKVVYHDVESGDEVITGPFFGESLTLDDKSVRKAERQVTKISLMTTFSIDTGEPDLGEEVTVEKAETQNRDVAKAKAAPAKAPTKPRKAPAKAEETDAATVAEIKKLRASLSEKYGSRDKVMEAGNMKYSGADWSNDVTMLTELLNG